MALWSVPARAFAAALLFWTPVSAHAQPRGPSLAGHWAFETDEATERQCTITGEATLTAARAGRYQVRLSTFEQCRTGETWRSRQTCTAAQQGRSVRFSCAIVQVDPANYAPDDFVLEIVSADAMSGALVSTWSAPARWRRTQPDLVS
jgi:hypothetical protein